MERKCVLFRETQIFLALRGPGRQTEGSWGARSDSQHRRACGDAVPTRWGHTMEILDPFLIGEVKEHGECGKLINLENRVASTSCISPSFLSRGFQKLHYPCFFPSSFSQHSVI